MNTYKQQMDKLANSIIDKCIKDQTITDSELIFIIQYGRQCKKNENKITLDKIINTFKKLQSLLIVNDSNEKIIEPEIIIDKGDIDNGL